MHVIYVRCNSVMVMSSWTSVVFENDGSFVQLVIISTKWT